MDPMGLNLRFTTNESPHRAGNRPGVAMDAMERRFQWDFNGVLMGILM